MGRAWGPGDASAPVQAQIRERSECVRSDTSDAEAEPFSTEILTVGAESRLDSLT